MKRNALSTLFLLILTLSVSPAFAQPMKVVASIYPVGDMVKGGQCGSKGHAPTGCKSSCF